MASTKNTTNNASSTSNDAGGFKTVAFGFDKNDVTLYIASLRKKMKAMEEEFEQKLTQAMENPAASNDALKHEREVIRAEMEKQWNDKIVERTSIIKNQQEQINQLEKQLSENNATIESLKAQLAAATAASDSDASSAASAKAAEAYMRFTAELRSISDSAQRTLATIEQIWSGEFDVSTADISAMPAVSAPSVSKPVQKAAPAVSDVNTVREPLNKAVEDKKPAVNNDLGFGSLIADDEEEDPFAGLIADINGDGDGEVKVPVKSAPEPEPAPKPEPKPAPAPKPAPVKADIPDEFASLLADSDADGEEEGSDIFEVAPAAAAKGDDLDADLLSDIVIAPGEERNGGDLGEMLKEKEQSEFDAFKDLFVSESDTEEDDSLADLTVTPIAEAEFKPGVSTEFDLTADENAGMSGLEDFFVGNDETGNEVEIKSEPESESASKNKEEDLFDFSFLATDDDEEDDMSSDVSISGML